MINIMILNHKILITWIVSFFLISLSIFVPITQSSTVMDKIKKKDGLIDLLIAIEVRTWDE